MVQKRSLEKSSGLNPEGKVEKHVLELKTKKGGEQ
jgi:hypothetical protein